MKTLFFAIGLLTLGGSGLVHAGTPATLPVPVQSASTQTTGVVLDAKALMKCAAESNIIQRLACFDNFAKINHLAPTSVETTISTKNKWRTSSDKDPLTDKSIHYATLEADQGKGLFGDRIGLVVRCKSGKTEAFINWNTFLGSENINVTSRVDKAPATTTYWSISTDHKASFMPQPVAVLSKFSGASSYVVNLTPYSESPITAIFDVAGANEAFRDIKRDCKWLSPEEEKSQKEMLEKARQKEKDDENKPYDERTCVELRKSAKLYPNSDYADAIDVYLKSSPRCSNSR